MKILYFILALALLFSCSENQISEDTADSAIKISEPILTESENAATLYVNKVGYFSGTDEYYVSLTPIKPIDEACFNALSDKADSVVFEEDGLGRFRLPMATAREAFDFSSLDEIKIYNAHHKLVTRAKLKRAEYVVDVNGYFVAVFKPENSVPLNETGDYCLGMTEVSMMSIRTQTIEDEKLAERIISELNIQPKYVWSVAHVNVQPSNSTFSVFAFLQENGKTVTFLTELWNNKIKVLYKLDDEVAFYSILPVPIEINGKPVLLLHLALPESDAVDDYVVATYDGTEYTLSADNRIKIK